LALSLLMVRNDPTLPPRQGREGWLHWIRPKDVPPNIPWGPHD